jgi:hypothetical protein
MNATGKKPLYYSLNKKAADFGYEPQYSSMDGLIKEFQVYFSEFKKLDVKK